MRDWLRLAREAADLGEAISAICLLEAERETERLNHEWEVAEFRRRFEDAEEWKKVCQGHRDAHDGEGHDPFCLQSAARLCESPPMVSQPLPERRPGG